MSNQTLNEVRNEEHHVSIRIHLFIAGAIAVVGALMLMTGALMPYAIVAFIIAGIYAAGMIIFARVQDHLDLHTRPPRPEELDSSRDYQKAKQNV